MCTWEGEERILDQPVCWTRALNPTLQKMDYQHKRRVSSRENKGSDPAFLMEQNQTQQQCRDEQHPPFANKRHSLGESGRQRKTSDSYDVNYLLF